MLAQSTWCVANGKKKREASSDEGWKEIEKKLNTALKPDMLVAIYCGAPATAPVDNDGADSTPKVPAYSSFGVVELPLTINTQERKKQIR
jgi:hypothetical protein